MIIVNASNRKLRTLSPLFFFSLSLLLFFNYPFRSRKGASFVRGNTGAAFAVFSLY